MIRKTLISECLILRSQRRAKGEWGSGEKWVKSARLKSCLIKLATGILKFIREESREHEWHVSCTVRGRQSWFHRLGAEQDQLPSGPTGTSSGNCQRRKLAWFGHFTHHDSLSKTILQGTSEVVRGNAG